MYIIFILRNALILPKRANGYIHLVIRLDVVYTIYNIIILYVFIFETRIKSLLCSPRVVYEIMLGAVSQYNVILGFIACAEM